MYISRVAIALTVLVIFTLIPANSTAILGFRGFLNGELPQEEGEGGKGEKVYRYDCPPLGCAIYLSLNKVSVPDQSSTKFEIEREREREVSVTLFSNIDRAQGMIGRG